MTEAYYFRQLDKAGQAAYHAMKTGLAALRSAFPVPRLEERELGDVLARLRLDCPELFYVTGFSYRVHRPPPRWSCCPSTASTRERSRPTRKRWPPGWTACAARPWG